MRETGSRHAQRTTTRGVPDPTTVLGQFTLSDGNNPNVT